MPSDATVDPELPSKQLLIVSAASGGLYVSTSEMYWSDITPSLGNIISGVAVDANYIYIASYATSATSNKKSATELFSVKSLIENSCAHASKDMFNSLSAGGLTIGKLDIRGIGANSIVLSEINSYDFGNSSYGFSRAVLGVGLDINSTTGKAEHIYVPSLGPTCNTGGYTMITPSGA